MAELVHQWIKNQISDLNTGRVKDLEVTQREIAVAVGIGRENDAQISRFIKNGPIERPLLQAGWVIGIAKTIEMEPEEVFRRTRTAELTQEEEGKDPTFEAPAAVVDAVARILRISFREAYDKIANSVEVRDRAILKRP